MMGTAYTNQELISRPLGCMLVALRVGRFVPQLVAKQLWPRKTKISSEEEARAQTLSRARPSTREGIDAQKLSTRNVNESIMICNV